MDEPMKKSGQWPNVAIPAGSDPHEVMTSYKDDKEQDTRETINEIRASFGAPPTTMTDKQIEAGREVYGAKIGYDIAVIEEALELCTWAKKAEAMSEQDTREKLEADLEDMVRSLCADDTDVKATRGVTMYWRVKELLDRQAAITTAECTSEYESGCEACRAAQKRKLAELILERYELQKRNEQLGYSNKLASKSEARKIEYIDQLEAERDALQKVVRIQAESFRKLEQELKEAKDGVCGSYADDKPGDEKAEG